MIQKNLKESPRMDGFSIPENLEQKKALKIEQKKDKRKGKKLKERY